jgi:cardiolipin synthase
VLDAAVRAVKRGVAVRLLIDDVGSGKLSEDRALRKWRHEGIDIRPAMSVGRIRRRLARFDLRNHRKLAVVDGGVGFAGSHNMVSQDYHRKGQPMGRTVDLSAEFAGPIAGQLQKTFIDDWAFETNEILDGSPYFPDLQPRGDVAGHVVPTGPTDETETFRRVLIAALGSALDRVVLTTPYLIPDEPTLLALSLAAQRGVEVVLVVPERLNKPLVELASYAYYGRLIEAGIRIYQHQNYLLHSKTITVDDHLALVGSANLDVRSFELNFELTILLYGQKPTQQLRDIQQQYLDNSLPVDLEKWHGQRPTWRFYAERAASLCSPLL